MNIIILEDEAIMMMFLKTTFNSYLVFMDILLKGALDGTQIAKILIKKHFLTPF
ncbi:response regulator receiver modulated diguanylate cyclase with PAS/PAC sensor [Arcobacter nitrofigilis DSM 7299]|uniref:Response regulator receiver modulated diguanylate cyclase with PAS/PAC sensor n=1 Tax=Arcobacter nitrofigilis (strain ATCC 33309 / DSM 7299 / CCUG 15893 / LMG 7604 / NCTC 12251 / CI) TaxID=572480 RepID=D5V535_ARCNC|nr:hypothetical protein [Arcobacter nitrofigilis]ADG91997.1 response regulator receiver modulated diguanylate cyclase with PAS/PAC sensor [Arcobacter nitrofigilis DSM 7299]